MIKNNKGKFIISSLIILLPILAAILVNSFVTPLIDGTMWGFVLVSLLTLAIHVCCIIFTEKTGKVEEQSEKVINITFWIIPLITNYVSAIMMAIILGAEFKTSFVIAPLLGFTFILMGNYMPKARQNPSFGVRIKWTLLNEENWNATHRFAGKLWVGLGILMLLTAFLPDIAFTICFIVILTVSVVAATLYSYLYHKKQIKEGGSEVTSTAFTKGDKKATIIALIGVAVFLLIIAVLMFVGKLNFTCEAEKLVIDTSFGGGMEINYDDIESVDFVESSPSGGRISGFASARLLFGWFKNDVYGNHIRYTYSGSECYILMIVDGEEVVIADVNYESTKALYDDLVERTK